MRRPLLIALLVLNAAPAFAEMKVRDIPPDETKPLRTKCLLLALDRAPKAFKTTETVQLGAVEGEGITLVSMVLMGRIVDQIASYDVDCEGSNGKIKLTRFELQ